MKSKDGVRDKQLPGFDFSRALRASQPGDKTPSPACLGVRICMEKDFGQRNVVVG